MPIPYPASPWPILRYAQPEATPARQTWARAFGSTVSKVVTGLSLTTTITPGANLTLGNRMSLVVQSGTNANGQQSLTVSDAAGNNWTLDASVQLPTSFGFCWVFSAPIIAGAGTKPVITLTSTITSRYTMLYSEYIGLSTAEGTGAIASVAVGSTASTSSPTAGSTSALPISGELVLDVLGMNSSSNRTVSGIPSGSSLVVNVDPNNGTGTNGLWVGEKSGSAGVKETGSWTSNA